MAGPRLHSRPMAQWAPTPSPASRPGLTGRQGHPGCCENTLVGRQEPQRLGLLTSLSTKGKPASLSVDLCLSAVGDRPTSSCQDVGWPCPALLLSFFHSFSSFLLFVVLSGPSLVGKSENALAPSLPGAPFPPALIEWHMWTHPGSRSCLFPHTGLMHLHFLFRASGTQQFIPTGKYKADGVLETVRLAGKLSRNPWLGLGTVSFHISKSFLSWGGPALPVAPPAEPPPGAGAGAGRRGLWGWALARTGFMAPPKGCWSACDIEVVPSPELPPQEAATVGALLYRVFFM